MSVMYQIFFRTDRPGHRWCEYSRKTYTIQEAEAIKAFGEKFYEGETSKIYKIKFKIMEVAAL